VSPRIFKDGEFIFWFHSYDALVEQRASVHVGKGTQNDGIDAKIWLEPHIEVARAGRALSRSELNYVVRVVEANRERLLEAWYAHKGRGR
jgi:hypothetical protein